MTPEQRLMAMKHAGNNDPLMQILMDIAGKLDSLTDGHRDTRELIEDHIKGDAHLLDVVKSAFPGDDPEGHRRYHEALIEEAKERRDFYKKLFFEISKYGLLGFAGWLVIQIWNGALKGPA